MVAGKRVVLTTWGTFGDLHPFLALAVELKRRGHRPLLATCEVYRAKVESEGIEFAPMRPDVGKLKDQPEVFKRAFHPLRGSEYIIRDLMVRPIAESFADLEACARDADLLISHSVTYATPLFAEARGIRWISVALQPSILFSVYDPPRVPQTAWARRFPIPIRRLVFSAARAYSRRWFGPYEDLRRSLGLPRTKRHPMIEGQYSPHGTLGLFSSVLAQRQPDWPPNMVVTGFPFYDRLDAASTKLSEGLEAFLAAGDPPLVFTLGTSAVFGAGDFWEVSAEATRRLKRRAVFLVGPDFVRDVKVRPDIFISGYEPHSQLFSRAAAIIHQGGIGTTGEALRSGVPQLVVSFSHDQPDNGSRVAEAGAGLTLRRYKYSVERAHETLDSLLTNQLLKVTANQVGVRVRDEQSVADSGDFIEKLCV